MDYNMREICFVLDFFIVRADHKSIRKVLNTKYYLVTLIIQFFWD